MLQRWALHQKNHHLLDRDCRHPHPPLQRRAEAFHSVQHLCVGLENLLGQLVNPVCALTALVCSMYIVCTYIAYTVSFPVYTQYVHVYALHMGTK